MLFIKLDPIKELVCIYRGSMVMLKSFGSTLTTMPFEEKINRYPIPNLLATFVTDD